jgi:hypothetical protein
MTFQEFRRLRTGKLTSAVGFFRSQSEFRETENPYREFPK